LIASNAANAPFSASLKVEEALPVTEVINPILMVVGVTPGALAVLPDEPPPDVADVEDPPEVVVDPPDVVLDELLLLLLEQPAAIIAASAPTNTRLLYLCLMCMSPLALGLLWPRNL
jgi:hypothetical protein